MSRFRAAYGAGPLHLLALAGSLLVAAYAFSRSFDELTDPAYFVLWFGGSVAAHDLVLFPLYALAGLIVAAALVPASGASQVRIAALNHLRVPALLSGVLLLVWFPSIAGVNEGGFVRAAGLSSDVYLGRWLLLSAVLFAASLQLFALRAAGLARHS